MRRIAIPDLITFTAPTLGLVAKNRRGINDVNVWKTLQVQSSASLGQDADAAVYQANNRGRNQVVLSSV